MVGGGPAYEDEPAHADAAVITITAGGDVTTKKIGDMAYARAFHMSVVLPDGKVVVVGGQPFPVPFSDADAVLVPGAACDPLARLRGVWLRCRPAVHGQQIACRGGWL